jgi:hypothetical protein
VRRLKNAIARRTEENNRVVAKVDSKCSSLTFAKIFPKSEKISDIEYGRRWGCFDANNVIKKPPSLFTFLRIKIARQESHQMRKMNTK